MNRYTTFAATAALFLSLVAIALNAMPLTRSQCGMKIKFHPCK